MMSTSKAWVVVEGKSVDAPFYEALLKESVDIGEIEMIEIEDIEISGVSAGGKKSALKAHEYFRNEGTLHQVNNSTTVDWLFFLDRDDEDFTSTLVQSKHIIYTNHADVEAEVMANVDVGRAVAAAYSLPTAVARSVPFGDILNDLALLWSTWIALRLTACGCEVGNARYAQESQVNLAPYGPEDPTMISAVISSGKASAGPIDWGLWESRASAFVASRVASKELGRSVKGKWIPNYVDHLVRKELSAVRSLPRVSPSHLLSVSVTLLDAGQSWADDYHTQIRALIT